MQLYRPQLHPNSSQKYTENNTSMQSYSQLAQDKNHIDNNSNGSSNIVVPHHVNIKNSPNITIFGNQNNNQLNQRSPRTINFMQHHPHQPLQKVFAPIQQKQLNQQIIKPFTPHINKPSSLSQFKFTPNTNNESIFTPNKDFTSPFQIQTLVNAMNNSSLRQMSQGQNIKPSDFMSLLTKTVQQVNRFSMLYQPKTQDLKHYFRIIEINQSQLFPQKLTFSLMKSCSTTKNDRRKYQLLITLDGKEIKFQSMNDRDLHYNINLDTVQCEFLEYLPAYGHEGKEQYSVRFRVGQKVIQIFINQSCLPFHLKNDGNSKISQQYIQRSAKQIGKFLKRAIDKSRGAQFKLTNLLNSDPEYFMKNYATEQQFTQYCQTGDILLFKDRHTFAKIQRAITNSQYDHIAFVYRSQKYGVCLIQSSSGFGVSLTVWTHLVRKHWFRGIDTISWRRLLIHNKPNDYQKRVEDFITANKNKKYGISFSKLMTFQSSLKTEEEQKNRTYFCSQLVAQLYKQLGLIDQKVSSTQYWPKHFSQKGYLAMLHNSALDKERILVFDQQVLKENYRGYQ